MNEVARCRLPARLVALVLALWCGSACARAERTYHGVPLSPHVHCSDPECRGYTVDSYVRLRSRYGIGCMGNVPPGTTPNPQPPPESYPADAAGKPGVPTLTSDELETLHRIRHFVRSKALRFAWVGGSPGEFIIFDAYDGPCETWAPGYAVLNGDCNELYEPGENPYYTHAGTGCYGTPPPWTTPEPRAHRAGR